MLFAFSSIFDCVRIPSKLANSCFDFSGFQKNGLCDSFETEFRPAHRARI